MLANQNIVNFIYVSILCSTLIASFQVILGMQPANIPRYAVIALSMGIFLYRVCFRKVNFLEFFPLYVVGLSFFFVLFTILNGSSISYINGLSLIILIISFKYFNIEIKKRSLQYFLWFIFYSLCIFLVLRSFYYNPSHEMTLILCVGVAFSLYANRVGLFLFFCVLIIIFLTNRFSSTLVLTTIFLIFLIFLYKILPAYKTIINIIFASMIFLIEGSSLTLPSFYGHLLEIESFFKEEIFGHSSNFEFRALLRIQSQLQFETHSPIFGSFFTNGVVLENTLNSWWQKRYIPSHSEYITILLQGGYLLYSCFYITIIFTLVKKGTDFKKNDVSNLTIFAILLYAGNNPIFMSFHMVALVILLSISFNGRLQNVRPVFLISRKSI